MHLIRHEENRGVGAAIVTGYQQAIADRIDVACVMAADNQMAPDDLEAIAPSSAATRTTKANRLVSGEAWQLIPHARYLGNALLSLLTKIASGYWHVADSQSGFTAVSLATLEKLDLDRVYPRYGFPNDMLVHLNVVEARVRDVPRARCTTSASSRGSATARDPRHLVALAEGVLLAALAEVRDPRLPPARVLLRVRDRDVHRRTSPGIAEVVLRILGNPIPPATVVLVALLLLFGSQFTLFAMWFDLGATGVALTTSDESEPPWKRVSWRSWPQPKAVLIRQ